ncbi:MAG: DUF4136 domain-containing protein [Cyclobacteriaceae bacterium]
MKKLMMMAMMAVLLAGCYPAGPEYVEDLDVVYTTFDKEYDFQTANTYAMPDKIVVDAKKDDDGNWIPEYMPQAIADEILDQIETNMTALGWDRLDNDIDGYPNEDADVVLTPAAIKSTTYFYSYWYDWWYGGYWGGYWGWYYPPYVTVSSYTTGSMIMVIADPHVTSPINSSQAAWVAVANGLFTGAYDINRVKNGIDQAFEQSSYLKLN